MYGYNYGGYAPQMAVPDQLAQLRQAQAQPANNMIWVQGEAAAKSYAIPFGTSVPLFDSEGDVFYIKTVDTSGMPMPIRIFRYEEVTQETVQNAPQGAGTVDMSKYITRDELAEILAKMSVTKEENNG